MQIAEPVDMSGGPLSRSRRRELLGAVQPAFNEAMPGNAWPRP
jgi:hypothetical protein